MYGQALFWFVTTAVGKLISGILQCLQFLARTYFIIAGSDKNKHFNVGKRQTVEYTNIYGSADLVMTLVNDHRFQQHCEERGRQEKQRLI
jgi:hypothetical protein